jgi:ribosomal protein L21E
MARFETGDRVRIDIPNETDPDYTQYHGREGTIIDLLTDDASEITSDPRDRTIYRVELDDETIADFRWRDLRPPLSE